jgi:hypothetical protein
VFGASPHTSFADLREPFRTVPWGIHFSEAGVRRRAEHYYQQLDVIAVMQTPHRFRTKRHLWTYSGLALETHDSAQYRVAEGQLQRSKKPATVRGLNKDYNHDLKDIFKGAAMRASTAAGPMHDFYEALLAKGRKPTMARLTLARKIAAITLIVWKKEERFDANYLKPQAA